MKSFSLLFILLTALGISCNPSKKTVVVNTDPVKTNPLKIPDVVLPDGTKNDIMMEKLLNQYPQYFAEILQNRKDLNVQIIYTEINRDSKNEPQLQDHFFNVNAGNYFYPASTVKLPAILLALEKLNQKNYKSISANTTMITGAAYSGQTEVLNDPTSADGRPSLAQYIKKILLVSDNDAFNRVYEFLGQQYFNESMKKKGYNSVEMRHRVGILLSDDENRHTNPIKFLDNSNNTLLEQEAQFYAGSYPPRKDSMGKGYMKGGKVINEPMNFSLKNRISLQDLHMVLRALIFPNSVSPKQRFNLSPTDYSYLYKYMSQYPRETLNPSYDKKEFADNYGKFLIPVELKDTMPPHIRIFDKSGNAYGQMLDIAYIVDLDKKVEFFLSAVIYANKDGILNDDKYDYETVALPFLKNLAKVFYQYELKRPRKNVPDLQQFTIVYDK